MQVHSADTHGISEPVIAKFLLSFHFFYAQSHSEDEPGIVLSLNQGFAVELSQTHGKSKPILRADLKLQGQLLLSQASDQYKPSLISRGPTLFLFFLLILSFFRFGINLFLRRISFEKHLGVHLLPQSLNNFEPVSLRCATSKFVDPPILDVFFLFGLRFLQILWRHHDCDFIHELFPIKRYLTSQIQESNAFGKSVPVVVLLQKSSLDIVHANP